MIGRLRNLRGIRFATVFTHGYVIHAAGRRLREPGASIDAEWMRKFRASWPENAPAHREVRRARMVPRDRVDPIERVAGSGIMSY